MVVKRQRDIGNDPFASFRFHAEIDSLVVSGFSEVSGLTIETEVESFREGGVNTRDWQLAGPAKFPAKLTLKRGLADADTLWSWYRDIMAGRIKRKQVTIILMDLMDYENHAKNEKWRWVFQEACPVKWNGPELRAKATEVAFESIELIHRGILADDKSGLK